MSHDDVGQILFAASVILMGLVLLWVCVVRPLSRARCPSGGEHDWETIKTRGSLEIRRELGDRWAPSGAYMNETPYRLRVCLKCQKVDDQISTAWWDWKERIDRDNARLNEGKRIVQDQNCET